MKFTLMVATTPKDGGSRCGGLLHLFIVQALRIPCERLPAAAPCRNLPYPIAPPD